MRLRLLPALALLAAPLPAIPCTSILVSRGATGDGSTFMTYAADSHELYGDLRFVPPGKHPPGAMRDVVEWDTGKLLGRIPQAPETYAVVGSMNEHQVAIGESTFGGRKELQKPNGILDYGSLMWIALERSRTAREAIRVITGLVEEHGYASTGESFSISDPKEAWLLELIGKGEGRKGAVWVARRVPEGYVTAHANHPRIRRFPRNDPTNTLHAKDVVSFAREMGWYEGTDEDFSFADVYAPLTFQKLRACEARVWSVFRRVAPSADLPVSMVDGSAPDGPRVPLWVKVERPLAVRDVMALMRDHFDGTTLDLGQGLGAGPFAAPYRWRPMTWEADGKKFLNERAISTQQTGFSFVAQARDALPSPVGGVLWFGVDDTATTVYVPIYAGVRDVPRSFAVGTAGFDRFSWDGAFWVFNFVSNWAYGRWSDMIQDVRRVQGELEGEFLSRQPDVERAALALHRTSPELARDFLTRYSVEQGERTTARWRRLGEELVWKYLDGNVRDAQGKVTHPHYAEGWRRRMAQDGGDGILVRPLPGEKAE